MTTPTSDPQAAAVRDAYRPGVREYRDPYFGPGYAPRIPTSWPRSG
jgi:hypothetical protein